VAELIFLLNPCASLLILVTQPFSWNPNKVLVAGRQPNGGSEVTPIFLAPNLYKSYVKKQCNFKWFYLQGCGMVVENNTYDIL